MTTTAVVGAADILVVPIETMTIDGVAAADTAGITVGMMTIEDAAVGTGAGMKGMVAEITAISVGTDQATRNTSGMALPPMDTDIASRGEYARPSRKSTTDGAFFSDYHSVPPSGWFERCSEHAAPDFLAKNAL